MKGKVLTAQALKRKIKDLAARRVKKEQGMGLLKTPGEVEKRKQEIQGQLGQVADGIVDGMICKFESRRFIRVSFTNDGERFPNGGFWGRKQVGIDRFDMYRERIIYACNYFREPITKEFTFRRPKSKISAESRKWLLKRSNR